MSQFVPTRGKLKAPRTVHILSWVLSLDKNGYIPCLHKNCTFMALTLDEMVTHYHLINCLKQFPFTCEECKLSTDLEEKLILHKVFVHSYIPTRLEKKDLSIFLDVKKEVSSNLRKGWELYLKNKGYLKCLVKPCSVVLDSLVEMEDHYLNICREEFWALLISKCKYCQGKFECAERMSAHVQRHHCNVAEEVRAYKESHSASELSSEWTHQILTSKQAACPVPYCKFLSNNLVLLEKHYTSCTGKMLGIYKICPFCHCWLQNEMKLNEHMRCLHKGETLAPRLEKSNDQEESNDAPSSNNLLDEPDTRTYTTIKEEICDDTSSVYSDNSIYNTFVLKPVLHRQKNKSQSIDCDKNDISEVQFSEEMMDLKALIVEPSVGGAPCLVNPALLESEHDDKQQVKSMSRNIKTKAPLILEPSPAPTPLPTSLEEVASNLQGQATSTPLQIEVDQQEFKVTVNIPQQPPIPASKEDTFPQNIDSLYEVLRNDSFKLLTTISKKISPRSDMKKIFDPYDKNVCSLKFSVKKNISSSLESGKNGGENFTAETGMRRDGALVSNEKSIDQSESLVEGDIQGDVPPRNITGEDKVESEIIINHSGLQEERTKNTEVGFYDLDSRDVMKNVSADESTNMKSPSVKDREPSSSDVLAQFPDSKGIVNGKLQSGTKSLSFLSMGPSNKNNYSSNIKKIELSSKGIVRNKIISKYENEVKEGSSLSTNLSAISEKNTFNPEMPNKNKKHVFTRNKIPSESVSYSNNESLTLDVTSDPLGTLPQSCSGSEGSSNEKVSQLTSQVEDWARDGNTRNKPDLEDNFDCQGKSFNSESSNKEKYDAIECLHLFCDEEGMNDESHGTPYNKEESTEQVLLEYREKLALQRAKNLVSDPPSEKKGHGPVATPETELPKNELLIKNTKTTLFIGAIKGNLSKMRNEILCAADNEELKSASFDMKQTNILSSEESPLLGEPVDKYFSLGLAKKRGRSRSLNENVRTKYYKTYSPSTDRKVFSNVGDRSSEKKVYKRSTTQDTIQREWRKKRRSLGDCELASSSQFESQISVPLNSRKKQYRQKRSISQSTEVGSSDNDCLMDGGPSNEISGIKKCKNYHQREAVKEPTSISSVQQGMATGPFSTENDHFIDHKYEPQSSESGSTTIKNSIGKKPGPETCFSLKSNPTCNSSSTSTTLNMVSTAISPQQYSDIETIEVQGNENAIFKTTNVWNEDTNAENQSAPKKSSLETSPLSTSPDQFLSSEDEVADFSKEESPLNDSVSENTSYSLEGIDITYSDGPKKVGNLNKSFSNDMNQSHTPPNHFSFNEAGVDMFLKGDNPLSVQASEVTSVLSPADTSQPEISSGGSSPILFQVKNFVRDNPKNQIESNIHNSLKQIDCITYETISMEQELTKIDTSNEISHQVTSSGNSPLIETIRNISSEEETPQNNIFYEKVDSSNCVEEANDTPQSIKVIDITTTSFLLESPIDFVKEKTTSMKRGRPKKSISSSDNFLPSEAHNDGISNPSKVPINSFTDKDITQNSIVSELSKVSFPVESALSITPIATKEMRGRPKKRSSSNFSHENVSNIFPTSQAHLNCISKDISQNNNHSKISNTSFPVEVDSSVNLEDKSRNRDRSKKSVSNKTAYSLPSEAEVIAVTTEEPQQNTVALEISNTSIPTEGSDCIAAEGTKGRRGRPKKSISNESRSLAASPDRSLPSEAEVYAVTTEETLQNMVASETSNTSITVEGSDCIAAEGTKRRRGRPKKSISNENRSLAASPDRSLPSEAEVHAVTTEEPQQNTVALEISNTSIPTEGSDCIAAEGTKRRRGRPKKSISNESRSLAASPDRSLPSEAEVHAVTTEETLQNMVASETSNTSITVEGSDCIAAEGTKRRRGRPKKSISNETRSLAASPDRSLPSEAEVHAVTTEETLQNTVASETSNTSITVEGSDCIAAEGTKRRRGRPKKSISNETRSLAASPDRSLPSEAEVHAVTTEETVQNTVASETSNTSITVEGSDCIAAEETKRRRGRPKKSISNETRSLAASPDRSLPSEAEVNAVTTEEPQQNTVALEISNTSIPTEGSDCIAAEGTKRRRGRPKKSISNETRSLAVSPDRSLPSEADVNVVTTEDTLQNTVASETSNTSITVEGSDCIVAEGTKRRRGRPKKSISNETRSLAASPDRSLPSEAEVYVVTTEETLQNMVALETSNTSITVEGSDCIAAEGTKRRRGRPKKSISNETRSLAASPDRSLPSEAEVIAVTTEEPQQNTVALEISNTSIPTEGSDCIAAEGTKGRRGRPKKSISNESRSLAASPDRSLPSEAEVYAVTTEETLQNMVASETSNTSITVEGSDCIAAEGTKRRRGRPKKSISNENRSLAASSDNLPTLVPSMNTSNEDTPQNSIVTDISDTSFIAEDTETSLQEAIKKTRDRTKSISNQIHSLAASFDNLPPSVLTVNTSNGNTLQDNIVNKISSTLLLDGTEIISQEAEKKKRGRPKKNISKETSSNAATHDLFLPSETPKEEPLQNTLFAIESTDPITDESKERQDTATESVSPEFISSATINDDLPPIVPRMSTFLNDSSQNSIGPEMSNTSFPVGSTESTSQVATKKKRGRPKKSIPSECSIDVNPISQSTPISPNISFPDECTEKLISEAKIKRRRLSKKNACNEFCCMTLSSDNVLPSVAHLNRNPKLESLPNTITSEICNSSFSVEGSDCLMPEAMKKQNNNIFNPIRQPTASSDNFPLSGDLTNVVCNDATPQSSIVSDIPNTSFSVECTDRGTPDGTKKKRGRPKRNVLDEFSVPVALSEDFPSVAPLTTVSNKNTPQNTIVSKVPNTSFLVEHTDNVTPEAIKKKRGRPKKTLSNEICHPLASNNIVPSSEAPIKTEDILHDSLVSEIPNSSYPVVGTDSLTPEAIEKRRGRPRKSISNEISHPENIHLSEDNMIGLLKGDASLNNTVTSETLKKVGISSKTPEAPNALDPDSTSWDLIKKQKDSTLTEFYLKDFSKDDSPQNVSTVSKNGGISKESASDDSHHPSISSCTFASSQDEKLHKANNIPSGEITKKRGRPKKCISNEIGDSVSSSSTLLHKEAPFKPSPLKDTTQNSSSDILNISNPVEGIADTESIVITKKRGRPKKNISNVCDDSIGLFPNMISTPAKANVSRTCFDTSSVVETSKYGSSDSVPKKRGRPKKVAVFNDLPLDIPPHDPILKKKKQEYNPHSGKKGSPESSVKEEKTNAFSFEGDDLYDNTNDDSYDDAHDFEIDALETSQNSHESSLDENNTPAGNLSPTIPSPVLVRKKAFKRHGKSRGVSSVESNLLPSTLTIGSPSSYSTFFSDLTSHDPNIAETSTFDQSSVDIDNFNEEVKNSTFTERGTHFIAKMSFQPEGVEITAYPSRKKRGRPKVVRKDNTFDNESMVNVVDSWDISKCRMTEKQTGKPLEDDITGRNPTDRFSVSGDKSSTLKETNEIFSSALTKKRGRPRKAEVILKSCPESVSEETLEENHIEQENSIRPHRQRNRRRSLFLEEYEIDSDEEQPKKRSCQSRNSHDSHGRRRVQSGRIESWTKLEDPDKEVTCAVCEESMTALSYQSDHLKKHNFMTWIVGEEPWPLEDENYMYNVLTRGRKKFPGFVFTCELCNDQRKSAKGYLTHRQHCGKQEDSNNPDMNPDDRNKILGNDSDGEALSNSRKLPDILSNSGMLQSSAERYSFYQQAKEEENKSLTDRQIRRRILSGRIDAVTKLKDPNKQVKCAVCGETMTARDYQKKHLLKHNFIAWLEGEEPLPLDDPECMTNVLQRGKLKNPRFVFTCDICNERKKSSLGFLSHRQFCGRSVEEKQNLLVSCEHCGRVMMPFSLPAHLYQVHRTVDTEEDSGVVEPVRKAASRCMDKMASVKEALADDNEDTHSEDENSWESERLNTLYDYTFKRPSKNLSTLWKFQEERGENITCSAPQCEFTCSTYSKILEHFKACPSNLTSLSCLRCHYTSKNEEKMKDHVQHCVLLNDQPEDDINELNVIPYLKSEEGDYPFRIKLNFFKPALNWTKNLTEENLSKEALYVDYEGGWEKVMVPTRFIPEASASLPFCYNTSTWTELSLFQGKIQESRKEGVSFIGGPVWGLAWCPTSGPQYLAVGAQPSMETHFQVGSTYNGPGLIQLWALGNLNNTAGSGLERLELELGLCHEERGCWDLAWCPGGAETSSRLGLLAVATTSGAIPIYPVPKPHTLPLHQTRYYKVKAAVKLELPSSEKWQCSAISWSKKKPHRIIVAGFVNGMIGVWDLTSSSSLLRAIPGSLFAHKVFQAHNSFITGISLSPESEDFLISSGFDKSLKFWDLRDTGMPVTVSSRGLPTAVDWLRHWMMATTAFDVAYSLSNNTVSLTSLRGYMQQTLPVVASINSTSWDVSCNDWLNAVAACFDNGQVLVYFPVKQHVLLHHKERKKYSKVIMQNSLKEYPREESEPGTSSNSSSKPSESSTLYSESCRKYGLNIQTDIKVLPLGANEVLKENTNEGPIDIYPLTSINRVAWNPNMETFTYLASGSQAGLLFVTKLSFPRREQGFIDSLLSPRE